MATDLRRFFVALLPSADVQTYATTIKQQFADTYDSRAALRSPPHITLQPPFEWATPGLPQLHEVLTTFAQARSTVPLKIDGFGAFPPRVIYLHVEKTPALLELQADLTQHLATTLNIADPRHRHRPFAPHLTVAFRDLSKANFRRAWPEFQHQSVTFACTVTELTLLIHDGRRWQICQQYPLLDIPTTEVSDNSEKF